MHLHSPDRPLRPASALIAHHGAELVTKSVGRVPQAPDTCCTRLGDNKNAVAETLLIGDVVVNSIPTHFQRSDGIAPKGLSVLSRARCTLGVPHSRFAWVRHSCERRPQKWMVTCSSICRMSKISYHVLSHHIRPSCLLV